MEGSAYYDHHKRQSARQKTDPDGLRQAVSGAGLQKNHRGGDRPQGGGVQQHFPEYLPGQGRRPDGAGGVHVLQPVLHGPGRGGNTAAPGVCLRCGDRHPDDPDGAEREPAGNLCGELHPQRGVRVYFPGHRPGAVPDLRPLSAGADGGGLLRPGAWLRRTHAGLHGPPLRWDADAGEEAADVPDPESAGL